MCGGHFRKQSVGGFRLNAYGIVAGAKRMPIRNVPDKPIYRQLPALSQAAYDARLVGD